MPKGQVARRYKASISAPGAVVPGEKPEPPENLTTEEAEIWRRVVSSLPAGWFGPECHDLLARYCEVMARAELLGFWLRKVVKQGIFSQNDKALSAQQRFDLRAANMLAATLRFSPKARLTSKKAQNLFMGTTKRPTRDTTSQVRPWEITAGNSSEEEDAEEC